MNNKTLSIVSYLGIIGWLIAYVMGKEKMDNLLKYHLKQSLGLAIVSILFMVALNIVAMVVPALGILGLLSFAILVFWIIGMINAANAVTKPIPVVGKMFEDKFDFIK